MGYQELNQKRTVENAAYQKKRAKQEKLNKAIRAQKAAFEKKESIYREYVRARDIMKFEEKLLDEAREESRKKNHEYLNIRNTNNPKIEALHKESYDEHKRMQTFLKKANFRYEIGEDSTLDTNEAKIHEERRNYLNEEARRLSEEIKEAKRRYKEFRQQIDETDYEDAKRRCNALRIRLRAAEEDYRKRKSEREDAEKEYDAAFAEHRHKKAEFQKYLDEIGFDADAT